MFSAVALNPRGYNFGADESNEFPSCSAESSQSDRSVSILFLMDPSSKNKDDLSSESCFFVGATRLELV